MRSRTSLAQGELLAQSKKRSKDNKQGLSSQTMNVRLIVKRETAQIVN